MSSHEQKLKAQQAREGIDGLAAGMKAVAAAMDQDPALVGRHRTELPKQPIKGDMGEFRKVWRYTHGCDLGSELLNGDVGAVVISVEDGGKKKTVSVGRTPSLWLPGMGGHSIVVHDAGAGEPGDYLLAIVEGVGSDDERQKFRYLDKADLQGVVIRNGDSSINLGPNTQRGRQIQIDGRVEAVAGLLEK
jgi:hypothetical protein